MKKLSGLNNLTSLLGVTILLGASQAMAESQPIELIIHRYEMYLNGDDTHSIMKLYGKKPVFMPQHSPARVGCIAVKKAYQSIFANIGLNNKFTIYKIETIGNTAWARTSSAGNTTILANGLKKNEGNNELFIFKKESGEWKIHRYLFSTTTSRHANNP